MNLASVSRIIFVVCVVGLLAQSAHAEWKPAAGPLLTRWAKDVAPDNVLPEYPRPTMVRSTWKNLNGLWDYAILPKADARPEKFSGQILVPFCAESALSGVMKTVGEANRLWYRRTVEIPQSDAWKGKRVLLHFGAVDWETTVWINGQQAGQHRGGYDPFSFDITPHLKSAGPQEIVVAVWDPTDGGPYPRGKQVRKPGGIYYTPVTGIWQTVWLEPVPAARIRSYRVVPDIDNEAASVTVETTDAEKHRVEVEAVLPNGVRMSEEATPSPSGARVKFNLVRGPLWTPETPVLHELFVRLFDERGRTIDEVRGYFAMRKISLGKDEQGLTRIMLNNKFVFQYGPLDQGFWPDGLYTAPTDAALKYDIEVTKQMGFNMARKHVKVEPERWYYWCDKLGLLVWQDMPSGEKSIGANDPDITRSPESGRQFEAELKALLDARGNHPCIVMWVPYNEGWGQWDTPRITAWVKKYDPSRLVNNASGWSDRKVGDVLDIHVYPGPAAPPAEEQRAIVLGEFGGLGLPVEGHTWQSKANWGYRSFQTKGELDTAYAGLIQRLPPLIARGLSAAVYTQTTDVETEVNGLLTYDRADIKLTAPRLAEINRRAFLPPPKVTVVIPTSQVEGRDWRYATEKPAEGWSKPDFDAAKWRTGPGGFGAAGTPGGQVRTKWATADIWLRGERSLPEKKLAAPHLLLHHDEDAEVYINGVLALKATGYTTGYETYPISPEAAAALKSGENVIAVHCRQTRGGQYIDAGLVDVEPR